MPRAVSACPAAPSPFVRLTQVAWFAPLALVAVLALYLVLALNGLARQDLDGDELITSRVVRLAPRELIADRYAHGHAPLYFLLVSGWTRLFGHTGLVLLSFSVLIGALGVLVAYGVTRELAMGRWALLAALFWAIHPTVQFHARYARPYGGVLALAAALIWVAILALRRGRALDLALLWSVGLVGAAWNHLLALGWLSLGVSVALWPALRRHARPGFWLALGGIHAAHAASLLLAWHAAHGARPVAWIKQPTPLKLADIYLESLGGLRVDLAHPDWVLLLPLAMALAFGWVLWRDLRAGRGAAGPDPAGPLPAPLAWRLLALVTLGPALVLALYTYSVRPLVIPRYLTVFFPGFLFCLVRLVKDCRPRQALALGLVLVCLMAIAQKKSLKLHETGLRECLRELERRSRVAPDEGIVVFNSMTLEAIRLFATRPFQACQVPNRQGVAAARQAFRAGAPGWRRAWLLVFRADDSVMLDPQWRALFGQRFYKQKIRDAQLWGYDLPPAAAR